MLRARLVTSGTVEEKIYRKQVFKGGLSRTGTEDGIQTAYFSAQVPAGPLAAIVTAWLAGGGGHAFTEAACFWLQESW